MASLALAQEVHTRLVRRLRSAAEVVDVGVTGDMHQALVVVSVTKDPRPAVNIPHMLDTVPIVIRIVPKPVKRRAEVPDE